MVIKFSRLATNLLLGFLIAAAIVGIDQIYRIYDPRLAFQLNIGHAQLALVIGLALSFLPKTRYIIWVFAIMVFLLLLQLIHYSYFGSSITPIEISLFFTHSLETLQIFSRMTTLIWGPLIICMTFFLLIFLSCKKFEKRYRSCYAWIPLCLAFIFPSKIIIAAMIHNEVGKYSKRSIGDRANLNDDLWLATEKTLLFYFIYTLPHQLFFENPLMQPIQPPLPVKINHPDINIIVVMGESLASTHLSSYGYHRSTSPFLDSLKLNPDVIFKSGISAGVATDVSLPMFFNMGFRADSSQQISSKNRNLFKMAKMNGFETYFISAQSSYLLGLIRQYLLPTYISHYVVQKKENVWDNVLVDYLQDINFSQPTFLVLHQRGSHAEYFDRYPPQNNYFKSDKSASFQTMHINTYDNSVRYTDSIIQKIVASVSQKTQRPTYIIITSDHGESVGEHGVYGHCNINPTEQHLVPIIIMALNGAHLDFVKKKNKEDLNNNYMSHYELSQIVAYLLGYKIEHFSTQSRGYFVTGGVLSGLGGYEEINFDAQGKLIEHMH